MDELRILAIETATVACSAALYIDGEICERHALAPREHALLILPMIDALLAEAGVAVGALDAIGYGRGPGSFTGVRIAASVVQGIAFAADLPVVAVSTLASLAQGAMRETGEHRIMAALDARMTEVYWGLYAREPDGLPLLQGEECVCAPREVAVPESGVWVAAGSGWASYREELLGRTGQRVSRLLPDLEPRAGDLVRLAAQRYRQGEVLRPEDAVPVYLRDTVVRQAWSHSGSGGNGTAKGKPSE
jgi:tRNA threonylcarbamoyladenosine biosynthesis protein TsaB